MSQSNRIEPTLERTDKLVPSTANEHQSFFRKTYRGDYQSLVVVVGILLSLVQLMLVYTFWSGSNADLEFRYHDFRYVVRDSVLVCMLVNSVLNLVGWSAVWFMKKWGWYLVFGSLCAFNAWAGFSSQTDFAQLTSYAPLVIPGFFVITTVWFLKDLE